MRTPGPLDEDEKRRLVLKLVTKLRCVNCRELYHPRDFSLVEQRPEAWVLGIQCRRCGDSAHIVVLMNLGHEPGGALKPDEGRAADPVPPITADDVLDLHLFLREFDGDLEAILT